MEYMNDIHDKKIAIIVDTDVEQIELTSPKEALEECGAEVDIVSIDKDEIQGRNHLDEADTFIADKKINEVSPSDYDAVVIPGGVANADSLRMNDRAKAFVRAIDDARKPLAVICHGAWLLISAGLVADRKLTSFPTLQDDIHNADGEWVDEKVVIDENLITSRKPDDLQAFNEALIGKLQTA
jgi:protease I